MFELGVSVVCVSFGIYWGISMKDENSLKQKELLRREREIEERVREAISTK